MDFRDLEVSEDDVVLINVHRGLRLQGKNAHNLLLAFRGQGKSHSEIELFEILPVIHLWLVINETSLVRRFLAWPAGIRRGGAVRLRLGAGEVVRAKGAESK